MSPGGVLMLLDLEGGPRASGDEPHRNYPRRYPPVWSPRERG